MHKYQHSNMRNMGGKTRHRTLPKIINLKGMASSESRSDEVSENSQ